jgi:cyclopropane-fatty-acyl-phospholipid synthase
MSITGGGIIMKESKSAVSPAAALSHEATVTAKVTSLDRWLLRTLLKGVGSPEITTALWDGTDVVRSESSSIRLVIKNRSALLRLAANPLLHFGDDYSGGNLEIEGGLVPFLETVYHAMLRPGQVKRRARPAHDAHRDTSNTLSQSRENIHHHYDIGNDFYRLWLDREMLYTCAYFAEPDLTLEAAQIAKMELVCRKLRLKPGARVIEAGCGWGGLARYMAKQHGAKVRAFNISQEQIAYARDRAAKEGIAGVEYIQDDYRNITGECDVFVSVGMLEHVGTGNYRKLGEVIDRILAPDGMGLIHSIGQVYPEAMNEWIQKRIFPGSYPPTLGQMMEIFEPYSFSVLDVENLRLHYAKTLQHWLERFENHIDAVARMFDDNFVRAWRLYLAGSQASFTMGALDLFQVVFSRCGNNNIPWTRAGIFHPGLSHENL